MIKVILFQRWQTFLCAHTKNLQAMSINGIMCQYFTFKKVLQHRFEDWSDNIELMGQRRLHISLGPKCLTGVCYHCLDAQTLSLISLMAPKKASCQPQCGWIKIGSKFMITHKNNFLLKMLESLKLATFISKIKARHSLAICGC